MKFSAVVPQESARRELNDLWTKILDDVAPSEIPMLTSIENLEFAESDSDGTPSSPSSRVRKRGGPGSIEVGLLCIHLVAGTLALIDLCAKTKERIEAREFEKSIRREWQKALIQAGMSPHLADQIPVKFSAEMIRFITSQRLSQKKRGKATK